MISIEVKNAKEISKMFADFGKEGAKALQGALYVTALEGASEAQKNCPVKTNRLRSSIHAENQKTKSTTYKDNNGLTYNGKLSVMFNELDAAFGTNVDYAEAVNNGQSAHEIIAVNAKALAFKIGGKTVFAKKVKHPGSKGLRFMESGAAKAKDRIMENVVKAYNKLLENAKS